MEGSSATVLAILGSEGLLDNEQARIIQSKAAVEKGGTRKPMPPGVRHQIADHTIASLIDVIESLKIPLSKQADKTLSAEIIMEVIARHLKLPFVKIDPLKLDADVVTKIISRPYALRHQVVPVELSGNTLTVATANPFDHEAVDRIGRITGHEIRKVVTTGADIMKLITEFFGFKTAISSAHKELDAKTDLGNLEQYVRLKSISEMDATDQHVINAVEYLLHYAYSQRASDIHIEPKRDFSLVRFRIDGILHNIHRIPKAVHPAIVSRIKTLARMDIAEKRRPQDGRIKTDHHGKEVELRISSIPVAFGEKLVIRIFDPDILMQDIGDLGFLPEEMKLFRSFIEHPHGLILVTGPTGSGKTTTLYSALKLISTSEVNISTIEDPIEMVYEGFNQTAVNPAIDLTFANCLRTLLRQDPDIIMVGEIRDLETAENAIQASLTGHLVFSTLHTNDAPTSVTRLLDLGVPPFLINATVVGVIAQRLVRKVCPHCRDQYPVSREECYVLKIDFEKAKDTVISIGRGCPECRGTGYLGRTGIFEVMELSDTIRAAIHEKSDPAEIRKKAMTEGMGTLRSHAIKKLLQGLTTVDEIIRTTGITF